MTAPMTTDSTNRRKIGGGDRIAAAPQIEDSPMIAATTHLARTSQMTDSKSDVRKMDSTTTRNGKGMGSGSGRPLPSTHLEKRVSDRQSRDGAQVNGHRND